jgi:hypothetical protein
MWPSGREDMGSWGSKIAFHSYLLQEATGCRTSDRNAFSTMSPLSTEKKNRNNKNIYSTKIFLIIECPNRSTNEMWGNCYMYFRGQQALK